MSEQSSDPMGNDGSQVNPDPVPVDENTLDASKYSMPAEEIVAAMNDLVGQHKRIVAGKLRAVSDAINANMQLYPMGLPQDLASVLNVSNVYADNLDPRQVVGPGVGPQMLQGPGVPWPQPQPGPATMNSSTAG